MTHFGHPSDAPPHLQGGRGHRFSGGNVQISPRNRQQPQPPPPGARPRGPDPRQFNFAPPHIMAQHGGGPPPQQQGPHQGPHPNQPPRQPMPQFMKPTNHKRKRKWRQNPGRNPNNAQHLGNVRPPHYQNASQSELFHEHQRQYHQYGPSNFGPNFQQMRGMSQQHQQPHPQGPHWKRPRTDRVNAVQQNQRFQREKKVQQLRSKKKRKSKKKKKNAGQQNVLVSKLPHYQGSQQQNRGGRGRRSRGRGGRGRGGHRGGHRRRNSGPQPPLQHRRPQRAPRCDDDDDGDSTMVEGGGSVPDPRNPLFGADRSLARSLSPVRDSYLPRRRRNQVDRSCVRVIESDQSSSPFWDDFDDVGARRADFAAPDKSMSSGPRVLNPFDGSATPLYDPTDSSAYKELYRLRVSRGDEYMTGYAKRQRTVKAEQEKAIFVEKFGNAAPTYYKQLEKMRVSNPYMKMTEFFEQMHSRRLSLEDDDEPLEVSDAFAMPSSSSSSSSSANAPPAAPSSSSAMQEDDAATDAAPSASHSPSADGMEDSAPASVASSTATHSWDTPPSYTAFATPSRPPPLTASHSSSSSSSSPSSSVAAAAPVTPAADAKKPPFTVPGSRSPTSAARKFKQSLMQRTKEEQEEEDLAILHAQVIEDSRRKTSRSPAPACGWIFGPSPMSLFLSKIT